MLWPFLNSFAFYRRKHSSLAGAFKSDYLYPVSSSNYCLHPNSLFLILLIKQIVEHARRLGEYLHPIVSYNDNSNTQRHKQKFFLSIRSTTKAKGSKNLQEVYCKILKSRCLRMSPSITRISYSQKVQAVSLTSSTSSGISRDVQCSRPYQLQHISINLHLLEVSIDDVNSEKQSVREHLEFVMKLNDPVKQHLPHGFAQILLVNEVVCDHLLSLLDQKHMLNVFAKVLRDGLLL